MTRTLRSYRTVRFAVAIAAALTVGACATNPNGDENGLAGGGIGGVATPGSTQDFAVNVGDRVFFETDSSDLTPTARATLDKQAQWLQRYPPLQLHHRRPRRRARHPRVQHRARRPPRPDRARLSRRPRHQRRRACARCPTARNGRSRCATTSPAGRRTAAPSPRSTAPPPAPDSSDKPGSGPASAGPSLFWPVRWRPRRGKRPDSTAFVPAGSHFGRGPPRNWRHLPLARLASCARAGVSSILSLPRGRHGLASAPAWPSRSRTGPSCARPPTVAQLFGSPPQAEPRVDGGELIVRLNQLEGQVRQLNGQIEQLQFRNQQLEQSLRRMQEDFEFRFQELSGRGGAPAASRPGAVAPPQQQRPPQAAPLRAPRRRRRRAAAPLRCVRSVGRAQRARRAAGARRRRPNASGAASARRRPGRRPRRPRVRPAARHHRARRRAPRATPRWRRPRRRR